MKKYSIILEIINEDPIELISSKIDEVILSYEEFAEENLKKKEDSEN